MFSLGGGIGRATALAFAQAGATGLLIADINLEAAKSSVSDIVAASKQPGLRVETMSVDVTVQESVELAFQKAVDSFGRVDYCVTCAGVSYGVLLIFIIFLDSNNGCASGSGKDTSTNRRCNRARVHPHPERQCDRDILRPSSCIGHNENSGVQAKLPGHIITGRQR